MVPSNAMVLAKQLGSAGLHHAHTGCLIRGRSLYIIRIGPYHKRFESPHSATCPDHVLLHRLVIPAERVSRTLNLST